MCNLVPWLFSFPEVLIVVSLESSALINNLVKSTHLNVRK